VVRVDDGVELPLNGLRFCREPASMLGTIEGEPARPGPYDERVGVQDLEGKDEVMRAILGPTTASHPRAAATFLEGLSLWHQQALSVVLCADVEVCSSATRLLDQLGFGTRTVHYDVEVAFLAHPRRGRRIQGFGNFGDLRQLCLEGVTP
jgi:hypothetical protein